MVRERRWRQARAARPVKAVPQETREVRLDLAPHLSPGGGVAWLGPDAAVAAARILTEVFQDAAAAHREPTR